MLVRFVHVMLLSIVPWVELRLAIPYGIAKEGLHPFVAFAAAVLASWAVIVPVFIGLDLFYVRFLSRSPLVRRLIEEVRRHGRTYVERWGVLGVGIYVSLPLPGPGVYSGAVLAWTFGLPRRQAIAALLIGVLVSAILVTLISTGLIAVFRRFV
ncbi:MAG TPA: small multi-drug export protein [bacterium]|nr:small multi-drug export protein [bacterium]